MQSARDALTEPAAAAPALQRAAAEVFDWLLRETRDERYIDHIIAALGTRLRGAGLSVARISLHLRAHHPEWRGATLLWHPGLETAEVLLRDYGVLTSDLYLKSPIHAIHGGAPEVRRRLWQQAPEADDYPILRELRQAGCTDYVVWPLLHTLNQRHAITFASDGASGFAADEIAILAGFLPLIALVTEVRVKNILARTFLETYVGPLAAARILKGETRRGFGSAIEAATMLCDLRGFTELASNQPRDRIIDLLDAYFDAICEPIERNGGESLKFLRDGLLAILPLDQADACGNLLRAVREGQQALAALNGDNRRNGLPVLRQGVGVHLGEVSYGNIGSRHRLDFTVIGPVVNIAARLQDLTRHGAHSVLVSGAFAARSGGGAGRARRAMVPSRG
jgi:adenylate cyclase